MINCDKRLFCNIFTQNSCSMGGYRAAVRGYMLIFTINILTSPILVDET